MQMCSKVVILCKEMFQDLVTLKNSLDRVRGGLILAPSVRFELVFEKQSLSIVLYVLMDYGKLFIPFRAFFSSDR